MRAASFAYAFLFCALYLRDGNYPYGYWVAMTLLFLVYPHVAYWRALKASDSLKTELQNIQIDMAFWGISAAALGFPPWITFTLFITSAINNAISMGHQGLIRAMTVFGGSVAVGIALFGLRFNSEDSPWVTSMCVLGLSAYLMSIGHIAYRRTLALRHTRQYLLESESALQRANEALHAQLNEIQALQERLQEQANRDPLTGLFNRRYLESTIQREIARCRRDHAPLTLMMLDVDHFKSINDRFGHAVGDKVLSQLGQLLQTNARQEDVPCRFGGEEFVLLLPHMNADAAIERGEQLRSAFECATVHTAKGETVQTTVSVGISVFPDHGSSMDELTHSADLALYQVKRNGRNGVLLYSGQHPVLAHASA